MKDVWGHDENDNLYPIRLCCASSQENDFMIELNVGIGESGFNAGLEPKKYWKFMQDQFYLYANFMRYRVLYDENIQNLT